MKIISDQASVETANDYTKRNFVFRLHAPDGSEFLFGADSEEQQEEWVSHPLKTPFYVFLCFSCLVPAYQSVRSYPNLIQVKKIKFHAGLPPSQQLTSYKAFDETSEQNVVRYTSDLQLSMKLLTEL